MGSSQRGRATRFRPQMPMVRDPVMFTARSRGVDWRWGAFSNPHYTMFVGLSLREFYADVNRMGTWYAGAAVIALALAGLAALWTSKRAMKPLERVVTTAHRLTASDLAERIPLSRDDDREFAQLIAVLNEMMQRLEGSFQQAVRFTADASHELKTPLAVMLASLDDALRHTQPGSAEHERFASLFEEATRLKTITQSLLLLSQADAGRLPTHPETYDLSADLSRLIEDGEILCEAAESHPAARDRTKPSPCMPTAPSCARSSKTSSATPSNTTAPPAPCVPPPRPRVRRGRLHPHSTPAPPFPPRSSRASFERFFRGDKAHNRQTDGFGLGLNIAAEFARANHATLEASSAPSNDQTTFEVRLAAV
jgi:two-component system heavy metal sensor histidine kinase CusS